MRTEYQDDLSLYYLGRAAEGLGFYSAAVSYYRQSMELSGTSISCTNLSRLCGGVPLPTDAARRLSIAQQLLAKPTSHPRPTIIRAPAAPGTTGQAPERTTPSPGEPLSTSTTGDNDKKITMTPAVSPPAPAASISAPVVNPNSESTYIEPAASSGYLEPAGKPR